MIWKEEAQFESFCCWNLRDGVGLGMLFMAYVPSFGFWVWVSWGSEPGSQCGFISSGFPLPDRMSPVTLGTHTSYYLPRLNWDPGLVRWRKAQGTTFLKHKGANGSVAVGG